MIEAVNHANQRHLESIKELAGIAFKNPNLKYHVSLTGNIIGGSGFVNLDGAINKSE